MSREIKFRVYDKTGGYYVAILDNDSFGIKQTARVILELEMLGHEYIVERCTDIKDKYGKEVYDGDIVKFNKLSNPENCVVEFEERYARYVLRSLKDNFVYAFPGPTPDIEVIGNIHENPELLGGEK